MKVLQRHWTKSKTMLISLTKIRMKKANL